jgi:ATP/maltotriose-dependent transcriptional regulator MalT
MGASISPGQANGSAVDRHAEHALQRRSCFLRPGETIKKTAPRFSATILRLLCRRRTGLKPYASPCLGEVIDLAYYHGKSVKEIAEIVSISEATVKTRMFHARKKLAELVETT